MSAVVERTGHPGTDTARGTRFRALVVGPSEARPEAVARLARLGATDVAEAGSAAEARVRARAGGPRELLVVAGPVPDASMATVVADLRAAGLARAVVHTALEDPYAVRTALAAGVRALVVTRSEAARGPAPLSARLRAGTDALSGREVEVLGLVADGRSNRDIGEALGLSALTVKSHLARISRKLGTGDRAEMVALALRAGVIS